MTKIMLIFKNAAGHGLQGHPCLTWDINCVTEGLNMALANLFNIPYMGKKTEITHKLSENSAELFLVRMETTFDDLNKKLEHSTEKSQNVRLACHLDIDTSVNRYILCTVSFSGIRNTPASTVLDYFSPHIH